MMSADISGNSGSLDGLESTQVEPMMSAYEPLTSATACDGLGLAAGVGSMSGRN